MRTLHVCVHIWVQTCRQKQNRTKQNITLHCITLHSVTLQNITYIQNHTDIQGQCMYYHANHMRIGKLPSVTPGAGLMSKTIILLDVWDVKINQKTPNKGVVLKVKAIRIKTRKQDLESPPTILQSNAPKASKNYLGIPCAPFFLQISRWNARYSGTLTRHRAFLSAVTLAEHQAGCSNVFLLEPSHADFLSNPVADQRNIIPIIPHW